jgi:hypothetical protein
VRNIITNTEQIAVVTAKNGYYYYTYPGQPGIEASFPILSKMAKAWETYRIHSLEYIYTPTCSKLSQGTVALSIDYDAADNPPATMIEALNSTDTKFAAVYDRVTLKPDIWQIMHQHDPLTIRQGIVPEVGLYDGYTFHICVDSDTATPYQVGRLSVKYTVEFLKINTSTPNGYVPLPPLLQYNPDSSVAYTGTDVPVELDTKTSTNTSPLNFSALNSDFTASQAGNWKFSFNPNLHWPSPAPGSSVGANASLSLSSGGSGFSPIVTQKLQEDATSGSDIFKSTMLNVVVPMLKDDRIRAEFTNTFGGNPFYAAAGDLVATLIS